MKTLVAFTAATLVFGSAVLADLNVQFIEGAPKDRFEISSTIDCLSGPFDITIDLTPSAGALIFDVTEQGSGVEVFQPFELVAGRDLVSGISDVKDGDQSLTLTMTQLPMGMPISFTIDVDDTSSARQITVNGSEIAGAEVHMSGNSTVQSSVFYAEARAVIIASGCAS